MKTLIYTTFYVKNPSYESLIWEWLISLRTLGSYSGEVIIFDYGMPESLVSKLEAFSLGAPKIIKIEDPADSGTISNWRNIDVIPYLEEYKDYMIAHFDADIWFQRDISILWEELKGVEGCYFGIESGRSCRYRGPGDNSVRARYDFIQSSLGGFVFGGWIGGKQKAYLKKLNQMKDLWSSSWAITEWGTDQSMITYLIDTSVDNIDGTKYGCSHYFCKEQDGSLTVDIGAANYKYQGEDVIGVHIIAFNSVGTDREDQFSQYRFKNRHSELWNTFEY